MRVYKPILSSIVLVSLASCSSTANIKKIVVPAGINNEVSITAKKAALTNTEKQNWQHLDLATDSIPGMSVNKAYEFLKGKKGVEVIVGVVDSGTDLNHEDLKDVAWTNKDEIAGNGKDDDNNGYVDDIHGWNFLGDSYTEHLEYERILMKPSVADPETLAEVKAYQAEKVKDAKELKFNYQNYLSGILFADKALKDHFKKDEYTFEEVEAIKNPSDELKQAIGVAIGFVKANKMTMSGIQKELKKEIKKAEKTINGDNLKNDYRTVVGDDPYDINDKPGYGNGNTGHSEEGESHGSHVSGIIAAARNNGKGMNGVATNVKIMAVRSVSDGDEYDKDVALGIRYAVDNGAKVINTSFGKAFSPNKEWVYDAIKYAADKDVLIVNAAGNDGKNIDVEKTFPNDSQDLINEISDNFLTVGAMSANYNKELPAAFSNYGKKNVDIFAPGVEIYSTYPNSTYESISGTSMASPSTAGVAALIRSYYPQLSASQVKRIIMNSGTKINMEVNKPGTGPRYRKEVELIPFENLSVSGRVVNAYNALKLADRLVKTGK
ncbi:S8 family peptidase [Tenacibaculum jejuense]|uniref:Secreted subtilase family protein, peptidase S8 n=1 Tax=Tenacibaculum jejuense TaxID=584609 RepID=A0A238U3Y1_9FLAO|nr:Secreted subtilase family protein, peptidase S8 [Tenacibaculum jejuense]